MAFDDFRKEALRRKADVKAKKMERQDFRDWLFRQQIEADRLMDKLNSILDSTKK